MEEEIGQTPISKYLILDTNIFSRMGDDNEVGTEIVKYLKKLIDGSPGWGLAISQFTLFETMNEMSYAQELKMGNTLNSFPSFSIDRENLYIAAHLGCLYIEYHKEIGVTDKAPEPGDKIIAATAVRNDSPICTSNMKDYPAPFFKEILREVFPHSSKKGLAHTVVYVMQPQVGLINKYYGARVVNNTPKHKKTPVKKPSKVIPKKKAVKKKIVKKKAKKKT